MIKAIAIDDESPALKVIENFCGKVDFVELLRTFNRPTDALQYLQDFAVDLLFLDINMPSITGIELYKSLKQNTMVIFTTAYSEYAVEGFNLSAVDYLLKPFTFERFVQGLNKANEYFTYQNQQTTEPQPYIFIKADYSIYKVAIADILFIEGLDDYLKIHLENTRPIVARITLKNMLEKLPSKEFIRVHRSYVVPFSRIKNVRNKIISLVGKEIPIGASYEAAFFGSFNK